MHLRHSQIDDLRKILFQRGKKDIQESEEEREADNETMEFDLNDSDDPFRMDS